MANPTAQAQRAIDTLRAAGYKRSDFKVRTPCNSRGEYQSLFIVVFAPLSVQLERIDAVLAGGNIDIQRVTIKGVEKYPHYSEGKGRTTWLRL